MRYRTLGRTDISVSVIGFGASPLGNVFGDISSKQAQEAVAHAIDKGINIFDVSPYYGRTLAEERLGEALQGRREQVLLATKCGRYGVDHFEFSAKYIIREFEASLRRSRAKSSATRDTRACASSSRMQRCAARCSDNFRVYHFCLTRAILLPSS